MKTYVERTMDDRTKSRKQDDRVQNMGITFGFKWKNKSWR